MRQNIRYVYSTLSRKQLKEMLVKHGYDNEAEDPRWTDAMINFIDTLIGKIEINDVDEDYYATLHSDILGAVYGQRKTNDGVYYKKLIRILQTLEIIDVNHYYDVGKYSKGYRLKLHFVGVLVPERINLNSINVKEEKLSRHAKKHQDDVTRLTFDVGKANGVIDRMHMFQRMNITTWAHRWAAGTITTKEDARKRIYSNLTGLNREFRQCLTFQGEDLYQVDLKQAHQYLFIYLLDQRVKQFSKKPLIEFIRRKGCEDVERYISDVTNARFLDVVAEQIEKNKKSVDRSELKLGVIAQVFFQEIKKNKNKITRAFSDLYPTVWKYIQDLKRKDNKAFAKKLQSLESRLMNAAVEALYKKHPSGLFIRLHDAIITTKDFITETEAVIKAVGAEFIGWTPAVESSQFNAPKGGLSDYVLQRNELIERYINDVSRDLHNYLKKLELAANMRSISWIEYAIKHDRYKGRAHIDDPIWLEALEKSRFIIKDRTRSHRTEYTPDHEQHN